MHESFDFSAQCRIERYGWSVFFLAVYVLLRGWRLTLAFLQKQYTLSVFSLGIRLEKYLARSGKLTLAPHDSAGLATLYDIAV